MESTHTPPWKLNKPTPAVKVAPAPVPASAPARTRMRPETFTLYHLEKGEVSGNRLQLCKQTGMSLEYIRALTNGARYSLRGWSMDPDVGPTARGKRRPQK